MTNEVEDMILDNYNKKVSITYEKKNAYNFYKIIWKYILEAEKYNYNEIAINFKFLIIDEKYFVDKNQGVFYEIRGNAFNYKNLTYFEGCKTHQIDNVLNTNLDITLLFDLFKSDDFDYQIVKENDSIHVFFNIEKSKINKIINNTLIKNKRLTKNNRG